MNVRRHIIVAASTACLAYAMSAAALAQTVSFRPYIQPGDNGPFGPKDQMVVAWQTNETLANPDAYTVQYGRSPDQLVPAPISGRVVDDYLSADPQFSALTLPFKYGAHVNYVAVLANLDYSTTYFYRVAGGGGSIDQDDAATGTTPRTIGGQSFTFANGVQSFLDTSLSDDAMKAFLPNAGAGEKITAKFKSKVFSFAHIVVDDNTLTLYQISEPLGTTSSATAQRPAPFGTDFRGRPVNDPIPDTVFDPVTRTVVSPPATGTPSLLDKVTVTKPDISGKATAQLEARGRVRPGDAITLSFSFRNRSDVALNGTQAVITLPEGVSFDFATGGTATVQGNGIVVTLGRTVPGQRIALEIVGRVSSTVRQGSELRFAGQLASSTALPVFARTVLVKVGHPDDDRDRDR